MPRTASPALQALINSEEFDQADVFTFSLAGGGLLLLTSAPFPISDGAGTTWPANGPVIPDEQNQQRGHWKCGLDVDTWTLPLAPRLVDAISGASFPDKIGDQPMLAAMRAGILDGADVVIRRAYFPPATLAGTALIPVAGVVPTGFLPLFKGLVGDIQLAHGSATVTINDYRVLLSTQMPPNIYQAGCEHTLYDSGCKLSAAAFAKAGTVTGVTSRRIFATNAATPAGSGDYSLGRILFTGGENAGIIRSIKSWDQPTGTIEVVMPFPFLVAVGDTATLYPGCAKTTAACTLFANLVNFGGDPNIPPPTATGS